MTRSEALKLISLGAAQAALPLTISPLMANSASTDSTPQLKQAVSRWCYNFLSLEELCEACQEFGIVGIDLTSEEDWPTLKRYGITPTCGMDGSFQKLTHGFNDPAYAAANTDKHLRFIEAAADNGVPNVIVFNGNREGRDDQESLDVIAKGLEPLVKKAEEVGVMLVTETLNSKVNHPDYQGDTTDYLIQLCDKIGSANFKILYDIYHMQIMEGDIIRTIQDKHEYLVHYHTAGVPGRHEIDESQELFYPAIVKAIRATGFDGYLAHEFIPTGETKEEKIAALGEAVKICS